MLTKKSIIALMAIPVALGLPVVDLKTRQSCSALQLVHLSGTTENGLGIVGAPLAAALASAIPGTTTYSVTYDTSAEYVTTVAAGALITANYLTAQASRCPNQRFIISGYSKGALVTHSTTISSVVKSKVLAILVFGDPARNIDRPWPINSPSVDLAPRDGSTRTQNIASFCNRFDLFCYLPGTSLPAHLAYPTDGSIAIAANFVKAKV